MLQHRWLALLARGSQKGYTDALAKKGAQSICGLLKISLEPIYLDSHLMNTLALQLKDKVPRALAGWLKWWEHCSIHQNIAGSIPVRAHTQVVGLIPGRGVHRQQLIDVSLSHRCLSFSLSPQPSLSLKKKKKAKQNKQ